MSNRAFKKGGVLVAALAIGAGAVAYFWKPAPKTDFEQTWQSGGAAGFNVVVVTLDTTRADRIGCYGYRRGSTPVIDGLSSEGVRFADAVSCVPMTLPAHASIFTGFDPPNHGIRSNGLYRLDESHETLAETLTQNGYETAAFISAFVLDARYGLSQGFGHFDDNVGAVSGSNVVQRTAGKVTDAALQWLQSRKSDKPCMLWIHYFDPHLGYTPPQPFAGRFRANPYDGEIAYMDSQIGRLLEGLKQGLGGDRTLVVIVGDHGESLGEHHETEHSRTIYEATQHVPLILWSPGVDRQAYLVDDVVVSITDVSPTVLDLLGIETDIAHDGVSLLGCRAQDDRAVYMETMRTYLDHQWAPLIGLRRHTDKFILAPSPEYYDLAADPDEKTNIYETVTRGQSKIMAELVKALSERMVRDPSEEALSAMQASIKPDSDALGRLQALGYVSGGEDEPGDAGAEMDLPNPKDMMPVLNWCLQARALRQAGRLEPALAEIEKALERSPADRAALRELGLIQVKLGNTLEAEKAFRAYLDIKPDADVCWTLAQILMGTGRSREAQGVLRKALKLEPNHGGALVASGDLEASKGNKSMAIRLYERAIRVDPYRAKDIAERRISTLQAEEGDNP